LAAEIEVAGLGAGELARAGAGQGPRGDQLDDRGNAGDRADALADFVAETAALFVAGNAAVDQHGGRFLAAGAGDREGGDVARLEAGQLLDRPFDVLRPVIAAVDDDHVLGAADDEDVALRHVAHVAGVEPIVGTEAGVGRFLIAEIAVHDAGAAHIDLADAAVGQDFALVTANLDRHAGDRLAAID